MSAFEYSTGGRSGAVPRLINMQQQMNLGQ